MTGRSIMVVAQILARQNGAAPHEWRRWTREACEIVQAIADEMTATIPHEGMVNERDRKIGAGR